MKKVLLIAATSILWGACSNEKESKPKQQVNMETVIDSYVQTNLSKIFAEDAKGYKLTQQTVEVLDTITRKKELGYEIVKMQNEAISITE